MSDHFCRVCGVRLTLHEEMGLPFVCDKKDPETADNDLCPGCADEPDEQTVGLTILPGKGNEDVQ